jgi:hypothetical protein
MIRNYVIAAMLAASAPALFAQMRTLRPLPNNVASEDRAHLDLEHSMLLGKAGSLCATRAVFNSQCDGSITADSPTSHNCQISYSEIKQSLGVYNEAADKYNDEVVAKLRQRVLTLSEAVRRDQQAIRNLGLHRDAAEFDAWSLWLSAADKQRQEQAEAAFRDAATSAATNGIQEAIRSGAYKAAALNPKVAAELIARLQAAGVEDPFLLGAISKFAAAKGKQQTAEAGLDLLERVSKAKAVWDLHDLGPDRESATWRVGADLLEIFVPDPKLRLIGTLTLDEVRVTFYTVNEAAFDVPVFQAEVNSLAKLTEQRLRNLRVLSTRLQADVRAKSDASKELAGIDQRPADGACAQ